MSSLVSECSPRTSIALVGNNERLFIIPQGTGPYLKVSGPLAQSIWGQLRSGGVETAPADRQLEAAARALVDGRGLKRVSCVAPASKRGAILLAFGLAAVALASTQIAAEAAEINLMPTIGACIWLLALAPLWIALHEFTHMLAAALFGIRLSGLSWHSRGYGPPLPRLDLRAAWRLAPRDHALIHLAGPLADIVLLALSVTVLATQPETANWLGALPVFGVFFVLANTDLTRKSDAISTARALVCDPEFGPCQFSGVRISGPKALAILSVIHLVIQASVLIFVISQIAKGSII